MRLARKLMLLATMAIAAIALAAPSALAQTEPLAHYAVPDIRVTAEPAGAPCPAVVRSPNLVSGGCIVHGGGPNIILVGHIFGIESVQSTCNVEFDFRTDVDGEGFLVHQELTPGTQGTCARRPCGFGQPASPEGRPWEASARETGPTVPREVVTILFCFENLDGTNPTHCEVDIPMTEPSNHRYSLVAPGPTLHGIRGHGTTQPFCEVVGTFTTESIALGTAEGENRTQVEINHL